MRTCNATECPYPRLMTSTSPMRCASKPRKGHEPCEPRAALPRVVLEPKSKFEEILCARSVEEEPFVRRRPRRRTPPNGPRLRIMWREFLTGPKTLPRRPLSRNTLLRTALLQLRPSHLRKALPLRKANPRCIVLSKPHPRKPLSRARLSRGDCRCDRENLEASRRAAHPRLRESPLRALRLLRPPLVRSLALPAT